MHSLAFGANLQSRFATLRIFIRRRVQSCLPRQTALVYIAMRLTCARKRVLMFNRKGYEAAAAYNVILCASLFYLIAERWPRG